MYKAVINDNYLCHYNKNHSPKNGQFTSGDGDGDGISNDHANQREKKKKGLSRKAKVGLAIAGGVVGTAAIVAGAVGLGKEFSNASRAKKLNEATMNSVASKGKGYIEIEIPRINLSMDRVNARVNSMHERDQRIKEGLGNGSIGKGSIFGAGYRNNKQSRLAYELETTKRWAREDRNKNPEPKKGSQEYFERLVKGAFANPYDDYL